MPAALAARARNCTVSALGNQAEAVLSVEFLGGRPWSLDTVVQEAAERLPSIAITALVTTLAMLSIALNSDNARRKIMGPVAAIITGALVSSAIFNPLIMPTLMWRFRGFQADAPHLGRLDAAFPLTPALSLTGRGSNK